MQKLNDLLGNFDLIDFDPSSPENENATIYARYIGGSFASESLAYAGLTSSPGFERFCALGIARESIRDWVLLDNQTMYDACNLLIDVVNQED